MAQNSQLLQLAQDPATPLQTLQQLAQNYPGLRSAIALNPSTYPALLEWLRDLHDPAVDAALAQRAQYLAAGFGASPGSWSGTAAHAAPAQAAATQAGPYAGGAAGPVPAGSPYGQPGPTLPSSQTAQTAVFPAPTGAGAFPAASAVFPTQGAQGGAVASASPFAPVGAAAARQGDPLGGAGTDTEDEDTRGAGALPWVIGTLALILVCVIIYMAFTLFGPANRNVDHKPGAQATTSAPAAPATPQESEAPSTSPTPTPSDAGRPVPADALDLPAFYSPSGNIGCSLEADQAWCVLYKHNQTTSAGCTPEQAVVVTIDNEGRISEECSGADGELPTLEYGQTAANQHFACTSSESGMECWHRATGRGFKLSREAIVKD
ncbi:hypothetical protein [Buchananella felis]|uniref:variant leucine-rich repeat-containing protein n=1 Tax=Buchananella felis TaxID=3231492 RepID=UPI0035292D59